MRHEPSASIWTSLATMSILAASSAPTRLVRIASMMGFMPEETMTSGTLLALHHSKHALKPESRVMSARWIFTSAQSVLGQASVHRTTRGCRSTRQNEIRNSRLTKYALTSSKLCPAAYTLPSISAKASLWAYETERLFTSAKREGS